MRVEITTACMLVAALAAPFAFLALLALIDLLSGARVPLAVGGGALLFGA